MASVVGDVLGLTILRGPDVNNGAENNAFKTYHGVLFVNNSVAGTATQVVGGTDTLDVDCGAAIQAQTRNGKTVTVRGIPQICVPLANSVLQFAGTTTVSSNTVSITPRTNAWNANATITAVTATRPYGLAVTWTEA
jgi:hypothetical protein